MPSLRIGGGRCDGEAEHTCEGLQHIQLNAPNNQDVQKLQEESPG